MAHRMLYVVISILFVSVFSHRSDAQPTPDMSRAWTKKVSPKVEAHLRRELQARHLTVHGSTRIMARAYLEKNGSLKKPYIDPAEVQSDLPKPELKKLEEALLAAIKRSTPLPYSSLKKSLFRHLGLVVIYETNPEKLEAEITMPEDHPDVPIKP